jgi:hypothetical protein
LFVVFFFFLLFWIALLFSLSLLAGVVIHINWRYAYSPSCFSWVFCFSYAQPWVSSLPFSPPNISLLNTRQLSIAYSQNINFLNCGLKHMHWLDLSHHRHRFNLCFTLWIKQLCFKFRHTRLWHLKHLAVYISSSSIYVFNKEHKASW